MKKVNLLADLFRSEYSKIVSVLCKTFGLTNIQFAEDITSDTFLIATETWKLKGIPESPKAWLYSVAKNKAKDSFKRDKIFADKIKPELQNSRSYHELEFSFSDTNITDSQLKMIFAICNPVLSSEAQITMALRILCGFGINEIAIAFLTSKSTINKRLARAKNTFRKNNIKLLPIQNENIDERIDNVLRVIYLLFNEGYYSTTPSKSLKKELCLEAMRLNYMLLECSFTNRPKVNALMALLCFHSSRLDARTTDTGETILFANQDRSLWDYDLINKGNYYLSKSINNEEVTKYHLEASIASLHSTKIDNADKWENILQLYNKLLQIEYSPVTALNRTYALSKARSKDQAISEALKIDLKNNHLYHSLLAELYNGISLKKELDHLRLAIKLVKTINERKVLEKKIEIASSTIE